jgi:hypothetical protein
MYAGLARLATLLSSLLFSPSPEQEEHDSKNQR